MKKILAIIGTILGALLGAFLYGRYVGRSSVGKVRNKANWIRNAEDEILIQDPETTEWKPVKLPKGVKPEDVKSVELSQNKKVTVEVKHEVVDRRNADPIPDSAYDHLRRGI